MSKAVPVGEAMDVFERLRDARLKPTLPRVKVLEAMSFAAGQHFTVREVYRRLLEARDEIPLRTVHRTISELQRAGLVSRVGFDGSRAVFEADDHQGRARLVCKACGLVLKFQDDLIEERCTRSAATRGFQIVQLHHVLYGLCERCRQTLINP